MLAIWRYFDISYCLPIPLSIILRSMHVQQYACLFFVVDHTRCMVFDYGKYTQQYCIYSIIHLLYMLCSHFHNGQYSFETINHSSYFYAAALVVRCVLVTYSRRNTSKTAAKPPQIGATSISFQVVMLHIAYYASIMPQSNLALLPPAYATSHASKGHLC